MHAVEPSFSDERREVAIIVDAMLAEYHKRDRTNTFSITGLIDSHIYEAYELIVTFRSSWALIELKDGNLNSAEKQAKAALASAQKVIALKERVNKLTSIQVHCP